MARALALVAANLLVIGLWLAPRAHPRTTLSTVTDVVTLLVGAGAVLAALRPRRRVLTLIAPCLALALASIAVERAQRLDRPARFQRTQMLRARAEFGRAIEPRALVITSEDIGRPAENIEYYSGAAHALYLTDLERWRLQPSTFARAALVAGWRPYLLLAADDPARAAILGQLPDGTEYETVADIPAAHALDYFVGAPFHLGLHMKLDRIRWRAEAEAR